MDPQVGFRPIDPERVGKCAEDNTKSPIEHVEASAPRGNRAYAWLIVPPECVKWSRAMNGMCARFAQKLETGRSGKANLNYLGRLKLAVKPIKVHTICIGRSGESIHLAAGGAKFQKRCSSSATVVSCSPNPTPAARLVHTIARAAAAHGRR